MLLIDMDAQNKYWKWDYKGHYFVIILKYISLQWELFPDDLIMFFGNPPPLSLELIMTYSTSSAIFLILVTTNKAQYIQTAE